MAIVPPLNSIASVSPANGSTVEPTVTFSVTLNVFRWGVKQKLFAEIARDSEFTSSQRQLYNHEFTLPASSYGKNTYTFGIRTTRLEPGRWYARFVVRDVNDNLVGGSPAVSSFDVVQTIVATPTSPAHGIQIPYYAAGAESISFAWDFSSNDKTDAQTAYQILVTKVSDGSTVVDTGKVVSTARSALLSIPLAAKNVALNWKVRAWNRFDIASPYSSNRSLAVADPPVVTVHAPTENQVLSVATPSVTVSANSAISNPIKSFVVSLWNGVRQIWSRTANGTWANENQIVISDNNFIIPQSTTPYTYRVTAIDSTGMRSAEVVRRFTVTYTIPGDVAVAPTFVTSTVASGGYLQVKWNDSNRDASFVAWAVEERHRELDPNTGAQIGVWTPWREAGRITTPASSYTFNDYFIGGPRASEYRVRQVAIRYGMEVYSKESTAKVSTVSVTGLDYWLIGGQNGGLSTTAIRLHNVVKDDFTDESEEAEFTIMGRGRYVEVGDHLGVKGTLEAQIRDTGGTTAREKRVQLLSFKRNNQVVMLRNPFGDLFRVQLGNMSITRIAGTGKSEFCDISIPYTEVAE